MCIHTFILPLLFTPLLLLLHSFFSPVSFIGLTLRMKFLLLRSPFLFHYKLTLEIFQATQHSSPSISNRINGNFYPFVTLHGELKQVSNMYSRTLDLSSNFSSHPISKKP
ncbi:hypothetical protein HanPSC8_Chr16g0697751 [Helianthus annuus]|nr:hypothetical protein HanPSC8_Chr16g0697751 [Helianthus annuus]